MKGVLAILIVLFGLVVVVVIGFLVLNEWDHRIRAPGDAKIKHQISELRTALPPGTPRSHVYAYLDTHGMKGRYANVAPNEWNPQDNTEIALLGTPGIVMRTRVFVQIYYLHNKVDKITERWAALGP